MNRIFTAIKLFTIAVISILLITSVSHAQKHEIWGSSLDGGLGFGTIYKTDSIGENAELMHVFGENPYESPNSNLTLAYNGKYYGVSEYGGSLDDGILFEIDPITKDYRFIRSFNDTNVGFNPTSDLFLGEDSLLYGATRKGGTLGLGVIFSFNPTTENFNLIRNNDSSAYRIGEGFTAFGTDEFIGVSEYGGTGNGTIFKLNYLTNQLTILHNFDGTQGGNPEIKLTKGSDNKFYGVSTSGGSNGDGVFFSFDPSTSIYSVKLHLDYASSGFSATPMTETMGVLYFTQRYGGQSYDGTIMAYSISGDSTYLISSIGSNFGAFRPNSQLKLGADGKLYGTMRHGGTDHNGMIYRYDPTAGSLDALRSFPPEFGVPTNSQLLEDSTGFFWGLTDQGDTFGRGVIYTFNNQTNFIQVEEQLNNLKDGFAPRGGLVDGENGWIYGTTYESGAESSQEEIGGNQSRNADKGFGGVLYRINPKTKVYEVMWYFVDSTGNQPDMTMTKIGNKLYGTTNYGGAYGDGTIFKFDISTNEYTKLYSFGQTQAGGKHPVGKLTFDGASYLYGVTSGGGDYFSGTVYKFNINSNSVNTIVSFDDNNDNEGSHPISAPIIHGTKLYGTTEYGGINYKGVLYRCTFSGDSLQILHHFDNNAKYPQGGLLPFSTNEFIGVTYSGGAGQSPVGTIFKYNVTSSVLTLLKTFSNNGSSSPRYPSTGLMQGVDGRYYSVVNDGGLNNSGILFRFDPTLSAAQQFQVGTDFINDLSSYTFRNELMMRDGCFEQYDTISPVACDSFVAPSGVVYTNSGVYNDTIKSVENCDSVITINLTVNYTTSSSLVVQACDSFIAPSGKSYFNTGNFVDSISNSKGCDSIISIDLTINYSNSGTDDVIECDSYTWIDGVTYTSSNNTATHVLQNQNGCDSTVTLNLTINNSNTGTDIQEHCDSYAWIDGVTYTSSNNTATHVLQNQNGCDSTVTLNLTINNSNTGTDTQVHCDSYTWIDGNTYTVSNNTATHILQNQNGCDSTVTLNLTINNSNTGVDTQVHCDSYTWIDGNTYTSSNNSATHVLQNQNGCDSTVTLNLTINNSNTGTDIQEHCDSYVWIDGITYTSSNNTATHVLQNQNGCDSTVTLNLTINNSNTGTDTQVHCDSYTWIDGNTYTSSNSTATHVLQNQSGCDSTVTLNLTINNSNTGTDTQVHCDSYTWIDGNTYTSSNSTATHVLQNQNGCDSTVTLNLTINNSNTSTDTQVHCDSYVWINGITYAASNSTATHVLQNQSGCDSTVTLNLTINNSNTGTDIQEHCDSYVWIDGITYTSSNNTATHVLQNQSGCDSTVTLNLTINNSNTGTDIQEHCDSYVWIDGITYTSSNNTATHVLQNQSGCDSTVSLNLTINNSSNSVLTLTVCDEYLSPSGTTYTQSGQYLDTISNLNGCDSLITINLIVNKSTYKALTVNECGNYTLPTGTVVNQTGTYYDTIPNSAGCDSIMTFYVTINPSPIVNLSIIDSLHFCANEALQDLYQFVNVAGGAFDIAGLNDDVYQDFLPNSLQPGTHNFTYYIDSGCYVPVSGSITIWSPPSISLVTKVNNNSCSGSVGYIEMSISPGSAPGYSYLWNTGVTSSLIISDLPNAIYSLEVKDDNGCEAKRIEQISTNGITVSNTKTDVSCFGGSDGTANITSVSGMSGSLKYLWSNGQSGLTATGLPAGTHFVIIEDATECQTTHLVQINQPDAIKQNGVIVQPDCGQSNGSIALSVSGGSSPYTYAWTPSGSATPTLSNISYGTYKATVTDSKGCLQSKSYAVNEKNSPFIYAIVVKAGCNVNNGSINLTIQPNGGPGFFEFEWLDQQFTEDRFSLAIGNYEVTVNDTNGCRAVGSYDIVVRPPLKNEICVVTVDSATTSNLVVWEKRESIGIDYYNVYRESVQVGQFLLIDSVDYADISIFNDVVASAESNSWRYRISAVNDCGVEGPLSNVHKTIHINQTELGPNFIRLDWNHYQGANYTHFIISRFTNADGFNVIDTIPATSTTYNDFPPTLDGLDYYVGFELVNPCTATGKIEDYNYSRSNRTQGVFNPGFGAGYSNNEIIEVSLDKVALKLYPNPVTDVFIVLLEGAAELDYNMTDAKGKLITKGVLNEGKNNLNAFDLTPGVYFINVISSNQVKTLRFVK